MLPREASAARSRSHRAESGQDCAFAARVKTKAIKRGLIGPGNPRIGVASPVVELRETLGHAAIEGIVADTASDQRKHKNKSESSQALVSYGNRCLTELVSARFLIASQAWKLPAARATQKQAAA